LTHWSNRSEASGKRLPRSGGCAGLPGIHLNGIGSNIGNLTGEGRKANAFDNAARHGFDSAISYVWVHHFKPMKSLHLVHSSVRIDRCLAVLALLTPTAFAIDNAPPPFTARVFWNMTEQRPGQPEAVLVRLEAEKDPGVPVTVKILPPSGAAVSGDPAASTLAWWEKSTGPTSDTTPAEVVAKDWTRGEVIANTCQEYFKFRRVEEKRLSATVSWNAMSKGPLDAKGSVEVSAPGFKTIILPLLFDFREHPVGLAQGKIPPPQPVKHDYLVGAMHYPGWIPGQASGWSVLDPYPERKPALDYHDESSPDVASWEIKWALENGINFFMFCWYYMDNNAPPSVDGLLFGDILHKGFLKSPFMDKIKFAVMWENDPMRSTLAPPAKFLGELLPFWVNNYFKHPS